MRNDDAYRELGKVGNFVIQHFVTQYDNAIVIDNEELRECVFVSVSDVPALIDLLQKFLKEQSGDNHAEEESSTQDDDGEDA